jgi:hypothetical protein
VESHGRRYKDIRLREDSAPYKAFFRAGKSDIGLENTYLLRSKDL